MTLEALRIVLLFILFVGSVFILLTTLANIKLTKEKHERQSDAGHSLKTMDEAKPGSTHFSRLLQRKVW